MHISKLTKPVESRPELIIEQLFQDVPPKLAAIFTLKLAIIAGVSEIYHFFTLHDLCHLALFAYNYHLASIGIDYTVTMMKGEEEVQVKLDPIKFSQGTWLSEGLINFAPARLQSMELDESFRPTEPQKQLNILLSPENAKLWNHYDQSGPHESEYKSSFYTFLLSALQEQHPQLVPNTVTTETGRIDPKATLSSIFGNNVVEDAYKYTVRTIIGNINANLKDYLHGLAYSYDASTIKVIQDAFKMHMEMKEV